MSLFSRVQLACIGWLLLAASVCVQAGEHRWLDLSACPAHLVLKQVEGVDAPTWGSPPEAIAAQEAVLVQQGQVWTLRCGSANQTSSSSVQSSSLKINRAMGADAVAVQNIEGGSGAGQREAANSLVLRVPAGYILFASNWNGFVEAPNGSWHVDMQLASGHLRLAQVHAGQLIIDVGEAEIQILRGDLRVELRGAGSLSVDQVADAALDLDLSGAGSMRFGGRASAARIRASGVGSIDIEQVVAEPHIRATGLVHVSVGR
jgi:hypothetical protein